VNYLGGEIVIVWTPRGNSIGWRPSFIKLWL